MSLLEEWETLPTFPTDDLQSPTSDASYAGGVQQASARDSVKPVFSFDAVKRSISRWAFISYQPSQELLRFVCD